MIAGMMPELGRIGPFAIHTYTVLLDLAILNGLAALAWQGWRHARKPVSWLDAGLFALSGGLIGARAGHVALHWGYFADRPTLIVQIWLGGLEWHFGVFFGLVGLIIGCTIRKTAFRPMTDVLAVITPLAGLLIHIGCLLSACGYGREVPSLAGYPSYIAAELPDLYGITAPRLETQFFGIVFSLCLLLVTLFLMRTIRTPGLLLWPVLTLLGLGMFGINFTRGDSMPTLGGLRLDQVLDLVVAGLGVVGAVRAARRPSSSGQPAQTNPR